jgi:prevent-host-death family protein
MREIGIRELKQSLSATLRAVASGEDVRVTVRGRAVADIVPVGAVTGADRLRRLVADGRVTAPSQARPSAAPQLIRGRASATARVLAERDAER